MSRSKIYINIAKYLFLTAGIFGTLLTLPYAKYPLFTLVSLILLTNSQIRSAYLKNNVLIFSILLEIILAAYYSHIYGGYLFLILLATLIDSTLSLKSESYLAGIFTGIIFSYLVINSKSIEFAAVSILFYIAEFLFLLQLKNELSIRIDTETLYDQIRKNNYELESAKARLLDYSKQVEKNVQLEERNRISRELHDSIGHSLTGILMQVDACMQIMEINKNKGMELLHSVYSNINNCIEVVRETVQKLRPSYYENYFSAIQNLIDKFKNETGVNVELKISGTPFKLFPSIETVLYRNIQEAMTNSIRHGKSKNICIGFSYKPGIIELSVWDDGKGTENIKKGFGLSGMEERLQLIGGKMSIESHNGFKIKMIIPVEEG